MSVIWNGANFKNARVCDCPVGGGQASAALSKIGSPTAIKFKRLRTNVNATGGPIWPADADAIHVGDLGTSAGKRIEIRQVPGSRLIITNGLDKHFFSDDDGAHWDAY